MNPRKINNQTKKDKGDLTLRDVIREALKWMLSTVGLAVLAMVFIPFYWPVSLPALCAIVCGAYIIVGDWHSVRFNRLAGASILILAGILWLTFGMFIAPRGVLYCFADDAATTLDARFQTLPFTDDRLKVFYVTDPVRRSDTVRSIVEHLTDRPIFVNAAFDGTQHVMYLPLKMSVKHRVTGVSTEGGASEVSVSYWGPALVLRGSNESVTVSVSTGNSTFLEYVDRSDLGRGSDWSAVQYFPGTAFTTAKYVAYSDSALNTASTGDFQQAFNCIEAAYSLASGIELARNRALGATLALTVLTGNVGEAQYLSYLNQAFLNWRQILDDQAIVKSVSANGVNLWLRGLFQNLVNTHSTQFPHMSRLIAPQAPPPQMTEKIQSATSVLTKQWMFGGPDQSLIETDRKEAVKIALGAAADCKLVRSSLQNRFGASVNDQLWSIAALRSEGPLNDSNSKAIDCVADALPEPWRSSNKTLNRQFQTVQDLAKEKPGSDFGQQQVLLAEALGFPRFATSLRAIHSGTRLAEIPVAQSVDAPRAAWWDQKYLDWFGMTALETVIASFNPCSSDAALLQRSSDKFTRDGSKERHVFAPGIMFTVALSQMFDLPVDPSITSEFKQTVGVDPATLIMDEDTDGRDETGIDKSPPKDASIRLSEVLIKVDEKATDQEKTKAQAQAGCTLDRLKNGAKFENVAFRFSEGPARDGDIGYFVHGQLAQSLEDTMTALKVGALSEVIQTKQGFVILKLTEKR